MRLPALAALALVVAAVGCGPQGDIVPSPPVRESSASPELGSTPARSALAWWEALRARAPEAALSWLTADARESIDLPRLRLVLARRFGDFTERTAARVLYTQRRRHQVLVYMRLDTGSVIGDRVVTTSARMLAVPMVSRDGTWLIANAAWLRQQADSFAAIERFIRKLKRQSARQRED